MERGSRWWRVEVLNLLVWMAIVSLCLVGGDGRGMGGFGCR